MSEAKYLIFASWCVEQYSKKCCMSVFVFSVACVCCEASEFNVLMIVMSIVLAKYKNEPMIFCILFICLGFNFDDSSIFTGSWLLLDVGGAGCGEFLFFVDEKPNYVSFVLV